MTALEEYIDTYGYHFSKKLYEWAVSMMRGRDGGRIKAKTKDEVDSFLKANGITLNNNHGHDAPYVLAMATADYMGSSIMDDAHLARFVADYLDDPDGNESKALDHFVADCKAKEELIYWDEML